TAFFFLGFTVSFLIFRLTTFMHSPKQASFFVNCSWYFIIPPCGYSSIVLLFSSATNSVCSCNQAFPEFLPRGVYITILSLDRNSLELLSKLQLISFFFKFHILHRSVAWVFLCLGRSSLNTNLHNNNLCCLTHSSPFITVTSCIIDRSFFHTRM